MTRAKALARREETYTPSVVRELAELEDQLGGRQQLVGLLTLAPLTKDLRYVLGLLGDPLHQRKSLASICAMGNLLPGDLLKLLGAAALHKGQTLAKQTIGDYLPKVTEDLMRRAAPYEEDCPTCMVDGTSTGRVTANPTPESPNPQPEPCPDCKGSRRLIYMPTFDRQKLAIEMGGLVAKGGGISITNQNLNLAGASGAGQGALEQLQTLTDQILYGEEDPPLEGEVASPEP